MRFKHAFLPATALALALAPGAQAATGVTYSASGGYATTQCANQIDCSTTYSYTGSASCAVNCVAGAPTAGTFTLSLTATRFWPSGPVRCDAKQVAGTLAVVWSDATTTTASLTGRSRHHTGYALEGTINGGTNTFWPPGPIKSFVSQPPNSCLAGSFTGFLTFYPPGPI
jgi:hypothetical protein